MMRKAMDLKTQMDVVDATKGILTLIHVSAGAYDVDNEGSAVSKYAKNNNISLWSRWQFTEKIYQAGKKEIDAQNVYL